MAKIVIIGAGISGLTAGIYARKAGFETEIYEMHNIAGGELTGWTREGYHIDGCVHWLTGSKKGASNLNKLWHDIDVLNDDVELVKFDTFGVFEAANGQRLTLSRNPIEFKNQLLALSPEDEKEIEKFFNVLLKYHGTDVPLVAFDLMNPRDLISLAKTNGSILMLLKKYGMSVSEYSKRFKNPLIRSLLQNFITSNGDISMSSFILSYSSFLAEQADVPKGGSIKMAQRIKNKYLSLGGKLFLSTPIKSIEVKDKIASATLNDGTVLDADYIIPACDVHVTFKLLGDKYKDKRYDMRDRDTKKYPLFSSTLYSFAVDHDMDGIDQHVTYETDIEIGNKHLSVIGYKCYNHEPDYAPKGKSVMQVNVQSDYDYWKSLTAEEYTVAKSENAKKIIAFIENKVPALKNKLRCIDVATPLTYERYCGAYKGSWMSYSLAPGSKQLLHNGRIKGIDNLFMAGQWLVPSGGLPLAITGKWAVQRIAKKETPLSWRKTLK